MSVGQGGHVEAQYWIRQGTGVQGPFPVTRVRGWIAEGRVRRDMTFSSDGGATWTVGHDCPALFNPVDPVSPVTDPVAPSPPPPTRGHVSRGRRSRGAPRRHARSHGTTSRANGAKWVWIALGVLVLAGIGAATRKDEDRGGSRSEGSTTGLRRATFRGQALAVFEHDFTFQRSPAGMNNDLLPAVAVNPSIVGYSNTLAALVRRVKARSEVLDRQVAHICLQWNSKLTADEYGADRGHRPSFWVILSVETIRRIQNPGTVADYDWLKHYVASGRGRWIAGGATTARTPSSDSASRPTRETRPGSSGASRRGTTREFVARYEAMRKRSGDMLGVRLSAFLRAFGPPDEKMQAGGVLMRAYYDCEDGRIDITITEGPDQWVPWITAEPADGQPSDDLARPSASGVESAVPEPDAIAAAEREALETDRRAREAEAKRKREAEEQRARDEQEEAERRAERTQRLKAALPGVYAVSGISDSWLGLPGGTSARYELVLAADGTAGAALFVQGRARWKASGQWTLDEASDHAVRVSLVPKGEEDTGSSFVDAIARWAETRPAPLFGSSAGRPAGIYRIQGRFLGLDKRDVELARISGVSDEIDGADPELYVTHRRKQAAGKYVPTDATAQTLRAKYRGRVSYRLTLKKDGKFSLYYDIPRARAVRMSGTWEWDGTTLTLRGTKGNGRTLRRPKVDRFSFDGTNIDMDGIVLEKG